jgi:hypothetical protein
MLNGADGADTREQGGTRSVDLEIDMTCIYRCLWNQPSINIYFHTTGEKNRQGRYESPSMRVLALSFYCLPLTDVSRMTVHGPLACVLSIASIYTLYVCMYTYIHTLTQRADHWRVACGSPPRMYKYGVLSILTPARVRRTI